MTFRECVRMALRHDREQKRQAREQVLQSIHQRKQLGECLQTGSAKQISSKQISVPSRSNSLPKSIFSTSKESPAAPQEASSIPKEGEASPKVEHVFAVGDRIR